MQYLNSHKYSNCFCILFANFLDFICKATVIPLYFTNPSAANGAADRMQIHDTVSVPTYGLSKKYSPTATPQAKTEKMNCLSDSPKNIDSV